MRRRMDDRGEVAVWGAGGHARVAADVLRSDGWSVAAFIAPDGPRALRGVPVLRQDGALDELSRLGVGAVHVAIGRNDTRARLSTNARQAGLRLATAISPTAYLADDVTVGAGSLVVHGAIVNVGACLGTGAVVNTGATVDHDSTVGDFAFIAPGCHLAGDVDVGDRAFVGIGAAVIQGLSIGRDSVVGAGSVVIRSVPDATRVWGNPARAEARSRTF